MGEMFLAFVKSLMPINVHLSLALNKDKVV